VRSSRPRTPRLERPDRRARGLSRPASSTPPSDRSALQNAASIAALLLTTEALVATSPKRDGGAAVPLPWWHGWHGWYGRHDVVSRPSDSKCGIGRLFWPGRCASGARSPCCTSLGVAMTAPEDPSPPDHPSTTVGPARSRRTLGHARAGATPGIGLARVAAALEAGGFGLPIPTALAGPPHASPVFDGAPLPPSAGGAAVLVALFEESGETRVVLTRRSAQLRSHTGQVSFPAASSTPARTRSKRRCERAKRRWDCGRRLVPAGWLRPASSFASGSLIMPVVTTLDIGRNSWRVRRGGPGLRRGPLRPVG